MRIWNYKRYTWNKSLKWQFDEEKGTKRINWHWYQRDNIRKVYWVTNFWTKTWYVKNENFWSKKKFDENNNELTRQQIENELHEYYFWSEELISRTWEVVDSILEWIDPLNNDILTTYTFWDINFSNELNKYMIPRNKDFFKYLDELKKIELRTYWDNIDWSTLVCVDWIIDWKKVAELITLPWMLRLLNFKWDDYSTNLNNFLKTYWIEITNVLKKKKKNKRKNINMSNFNAA